jgi:hypothetical protein
MKALLGILHMVAFFGCCEMLPLTRGYFGIGYIGGIAAMLALKQHLLQYLPVASSFIVLHHFAAYAAMLWLVYRVVSMSRNALDAEIPGEDPGFWFWWPFRWRRTIPLLYLEPLMALMLACFSLTSGDRVGFVPLWLGNVPLEGCGRWGPCLGWSDQATAWLVQAVAWLPVASLWLHNYAEYRDELQRLGIGRKREAKQPRQPEPEISVAGGDMPLPD